MRFSVSVCGALPGRAMKVRWVWGAKGRMADAGRSLRSVPLIGIDIVRRWRVKCEIEGREMDGRCTKD